MEPVGLDTTTIQLLAQLMSGAKKGNRNVSGLMNSLDNPLLLALAGQLDPYYGQQQQTGDLYSQFASDASTPPAVKAVMDWVDQGMNKYQIEAQVNQLPADVKVASGYTDQQLVSMGSDMAKQRTNMASKDVFTKTGLRNPNDIYNLHDQPISLQNQALLNAYAQQMPKVESAVSTATQREGIAKQELKKSTGGINSVTVDKDLAKSLANIIRGNITGEKKHRLFNKLQSGKNVVLTPDEYSGIGGNVEDLIKKRGTRNVDIDAWKRWQSAILDRGLAENQQAGLRQRADAIAQGNLAGLSAAGRTPFSDQAQGLLNFLKAAK